VDQLCAGAILNGCGRVKTKSISNALSFDRYSRNARLKPALFVLLPLFVTIAVWLPRVWTLIGGLTTLLTACGSTLLLGEIARYLGRGVEKRMIAANGGKFTTIFLRHRDSTISSATKSNYHALLKKKAKRGMPTRAAEEADPEGADDLYRGAVDWLLEATRSEKRFPLVRAENIYYGFRRNLLGLKGIALLLLTTCIALSAWLTSRALHVDETRFWAGCILCFALCGDAAAWLLIIRMPFVEDAGHTYAIRLLAQCDLLSGATKRE
jgi:hypothetical protein